MADLKDQILAMNPHWEPGYSCSYELKRESFADLMGLLKNNLIVSVTGPRRVGKTVALRQAIDLLVASGVPRQNILFFSFDDFIVHPLDLVKQWELFLGKKVTGSQFYLFIDEVQNLDEWAAKVKILYDNLALKIIVSGSAGLQVRKGAESLAGRLLELYMPPIDFDEYLFFSGGEKSSVPSVREEQYFRYMQRQLPELAVMKDLSVVDYITSIVKKVIHEDMKKYFGLRETDIVDSIFKVICNDPGQIIVLSDMAKDFGINRATVSSYLDALERSFLVRKVYNFSRNARKVEVRAKKYYPFYTNLMSYTSNADPARMAEAEAAFKLNARFFWNHRGKEIDFLVGEQNDIGVEIKFRKRVDNSDIKWLLSDKLGLSRKIVVVPSTSRVEVTGAEVMHIADLEEL